MFKSTRLKKAKHWHIENAIDYFYSNDMESRVVTIFNDYCKTEEMNGQELENFLNDINLPLENKYSRLVLFYFEALGI